jgi:hypothetical protein
MAFVWSAAVAQNPAEITRSANRARLGTQGWMVGAKNAPQGINPLQGQRHVHDVPQDFTNT